MSILLDNDECAHGFDFWVYVPDYTEFLKQFPRCVERLRAFCAIENCKVKLFLGSENGATAALELVGPWSDDNATGVLICEPLAGHFTQPILRRIAFDDESDYAVATAEGFKLVEPSESNRLEHDFILALNVSHARIRRPEAA